MKRTRCKALIAVIVLTAVGSGATHAAPTVSGALDPLGFLRESVLGQPWVGEAPGDPIVWEGEAPAEPIPDSPANARVVESYGCLLYTSPSPRDRS